jgi:O-antigen/teichoic acid export membrane protein
VVLVILGYSLGGLIWGFIVGLIFSLMFEIKYLDLRLARFKKKHLFNLTSFSFWIFLTSFGAVLYSNVDTIFIGYFLNNSEVGVYRVVFQFTSLAIIASNALRSTLLPKVSRWDKVGEMKLIEKSLSRAITYSLVLALPILFGGILLGNKLLYFFYGSEFVKGYNVLIILLFVQIANIFQYLFTMYLGGLDRPKEAFKATSISCIVNILLNITLIPVYEISGAAIATFFSLGLNAYIAKLFLSRKIQVTLELRSIYYILISCICMSIIVLFYDSLVDISSLWLTLVAVLIGGIFYIIILFKLDSTIYAQFKSIALKLNITLPTFRS